MQIDCGLASFLWKLYGQEAALLGWGCTSRCDYNG
jgi:hypothetical protein